MTTRDSLNKKRSYKCVRVCACKSACAEGEEKETHTQREKSRERTGNSWPQADEPLHASLVHHTLSFSPCGGLFSIYRARYIVPHEHVTRKRDKESTPSLARTATDRRTRRRDGLKRPTTCSLSLRSGVSPLAGCILQHAPVYKHARV